VRAARAEIAFDLPQRRQRAVRLGREHEVIEPCLAGRTP
jgi:hypothetical protein